MNHLTKLFKDILALITLSALLGITSQVVLPNGIGLKTDITIVGDDSSAVAIPSVSINPNGDDETASNISLQNAFNAYENHAALFLDARSPEEFDAGHITHAINLPISSFMDSLAYLETLELSQHIITYCDGEDCNASIDLAAELKLMGFSNVNFFFGGWLEWQDADYPVESSP